MQNKFYWATHYKYDSVLTAKIKEEINDNYRVWIKFAVNDFAQVLNFTISVLALNYDLILSSLLVFQRRIFPVLSVMCIYISIL